MIVDQVEAFKSWLTAVLKPMCDADPAALAKYVLALIKKDKSEAELRRSMVGQLEVFLEGETERFVNLVFQALDTKEYTNTPNAIPSANPPNPNVSKTVAPAKEKETKVIVPPSELPNLSDTVNGDVKKVDVEVKGKEKTTEAEKEERLPKRARSRNRSLSRNRSKSRSRSWDRTNARRSRSKEKSPERQVERIRDRISDRLSERFRDRLGERVDRIDRNVDQVDRGVDRVVDRPDRAVDRPDRLDRPERVQDRLGERAERDREYRIDREKRERGDRDRRPWRKSPPIRRYERRRSRSSRTPSPLRMRSRSRSPRHSHRNRYRSSRSRSRSLEKRDRKDKDSKEVSRPGSPSDSNLNNNLSSNKRRCRDFDEKGYCMKGEMCPYDHGLDPVVLEDAALSRVLSLNPAEGPAPLPSAVIGPLAPPGAGPLPPGPVGPPMRLPMNEPPYNPQAPQMWGNGRFRGPRPMGGMPMAPFVPQPPGMVGLQRELIPVPVVSQQQGPPPGYAPGGAPFGHPGARPSMYGPGGMPLGTQPGMEQAGLPPGMYKKKPFDYNRLGTMGPRPQKHPLTSSLELKKVPVAMNTITHLNNHFSKFGKIVNIQVGFEGDPEAALITFQSQSEANAAYRCTEAVLNNRFIKVFWHNISPPGTEGKQENVPPTQENAAAKDRVATTTGLVAPHSNKVLNLVQPTANTSAANGDSENSSQKELTKEETKEEAQKAIQKNQDMLAAQVKVNKNKVEQHKEVLKIQSDLRKKKQELLDKQLSQQKILLEKMMKLPAGPQRDVIKETIKKTQESIESIKKDIEQSALAAKSATLTVKKTKEQLQKELLDMELEIIAKQQEGADTTEIQKKLLELKARLGTSIRGGRGRGRGGARFNPIISRHLLSKNNLVDNKMKGNVKIVNRANMPILPKSPTKLGITSPIVASPISKVDHRPTRLLVSGYETDEQDAVLAHFQQYGNIVDYVVDASLPSITLNYKTRKDAETALLKGKHFQDRTLSITWSTAPPRLHTQRSGGSSTRTVLLSESDEDHLIDQSLLEGDEELGPEISEEALLQDDDDEDEEDRSWRR